MGQHKILLGNFPCLQNHFWPVQHTHPELPAPQGSLPGRCDQPSAQLSLPSFFGLTRTFRLVWISWLGIPT